MLTSRINDQGATEMRARKGMQTALALAAAAGAGFGTAVVFVDRAGAAGVPASPTLQYAGTLLDNNVPASGPRTINVTLWNQADNGAPLCTSGDVPVNVIGGRFRVPLDACLSTVRDNPNLWAQVSSGSVTWPRTKLGATPYAIEAERAGAAGGALAAQLMQLTQQVQQLQQAQPPAVPAVPAGAVMAFDLAACPSGWTELTGARGRAIIGADNGHAPGSQGGSATVTLSVDQMPTHSHGLMDPGHAHQPATGTAFVTGGTGFMNAQVQTGGGGASFVLPGLTASTTTGIKMQDAGGGKPVDVTPPYLALIYCKKS
jgi:hypothetical protein